MRFFQSRLIALAAPAVLAAPLAAQGQCPSRLELFHGEVPRSISAAFWDPVRSQLVAIENPFFQSTWGDTWVFDGSSWHFVTQDGPADVRPNAVTWDSVRNVAVALTPTNQTWEWNGSAWTRRADVAASTSAGGSAIAFDASRNRTVLLTGSPDYGGPALQTWEWNGSVWTLRAVTNPPPRGYHSLTYDPVRHRTVMFGGYRQLFGPPVGGPPTPYNDTWEFDGSAWTQRTSPTNPTAAYEHGAVFDPATNKVVIYGGRGYPSNPAQMWAWDGTQWSQVPNNEPGAAFHASLTVDPTGRLLMVSSTEQNGGLFGWRMNVRQPGQPWAPVMQSDGFLPYLSDGTPALAFDRGRGVTVLFGGVLLDGNATYTDVTWEFDGATWVRRSGVSAPAAISRAKATYDTTRQRAILVGGRSTTGLAANTWEYDGASWTQVSANSITARVAHNLAYDPVRGVVLMHGGYDGANFGHNTYEWNGTSWALRATSTTMPYDMPMAFDQRVQQVLGNDGGTYQYTGSSWTLLASGPSTGGKLQWDDAMNAVVAWGGFGFGGPDTSPLRKWDGSAWQPVAVTTRFSPHYDDVLLYDSRRDRLIVYAGTQNGLWELFRPVADIGRAGGLDGPDGQLDNNDFIVYINRFFVQDPRADIGAAGGLDGSDGQLDNNDFIAFINLFFDGCGV